MKVNDKWYQDKTKNLFGKQRTPIIYMVIKTGCYRERLSCRDEETSVTWQFVIVAICDCVAICDQGRDDTNWVE